MKIPNKSFFITSLLKPLIPFNVRVRMRKVHQGFVFKKAVKKFRTEYKNIADKPELLNDLIYGWGNQGWSSFQDYSLAIIKAACETKGPILECGSGLSTIILGIIAADRNLQVITLEHHKDWAKHVQSHLQTLGIGSVTVLNTPLKTYGAFEWYDLPSAIPGNFSLVICDGPPHTTRGGRYGLLPVMVSHFRKGTVILLDDYSRQEEKFIADKWAREFQATVVQKGTNDLYAEITLQ